MCGRYGIFSKPAEVAAAAGAPVSDAYRPRYNAAPTQPLPVLAGFQRPLVRLFQWGLVPAWADSPKAGARAINARAETLADKPTFAGPVRGRRCVVLANGYYEWQRLPGGGKRPHWIAPPDGQILGFAGLWDCWRRPDGSPLYSFGIVTVPANARLAPLHERMPALLPPSEWRRYCDPALPLAEVLALLGTAPPEALEACPVPDLVNRVAEEGPALLGGE